jgi:phospholipase/lecithinase/hemolysin
VPTRIDNLIVFGDSLSDIGKKWKTKAGRAAILFNEMFVSPTGRYSDCRNWTDFMFEEVTKESLVRHTAEESIAHSKKHLRVQREAELTLSYPSRARFLYANYAEGGACGWTPASKGPFLGTFEDQVDQFFSDIRVHPLLEGATLFIIWFGANDLYTAGRKATEMNLVAQEIAGRQRSRLNTVVPSSKFIFVDMARPLTSVRYSQRLEKAERELRSAAAPSAIEMTTLGRPKSRMWHAKEALGTTPLSPREQEVRELREQIQEIEELERGVLVFNVTLARIARSHGDRVVELGGIISEETVRRLVAGHHRILAGASKTRATHMSSAEAGESTIPSSFTTIDEVHPTERVYRLIWHEIYEQIKRADLVLGNEDMRSTETLLARLGGPSEETREAYARLLAELPKSG